MEGLLKMSRSSTRLVKRENKERMEGKHDINLERLAMETTRSPNQKWCNVCNKDTLPLIARIKMCLNANQ